jgi:hypothetical protein
MWMNSERQLGLDTSPFDQLGKARSREWCPALAHKDERRFGATLESPESPQLIA